MTFLYEYLMFLGQVVTLVIGFIVVISFLASFNKGGVSGTQGHLQVQKLNEHMRDLRFTMERTLLNPDQAKKQHKLELKAEKDSGGSIETHGDIAEGPSSAGGFSAS